MCVTGLLICKIKEAETETKPHIRRNIETEIEMFVEVNETVELD